MAKIDNRELLKNAKRMLKKDGSHNYTQLDYIQLVIFKFLMYKEFYVIKNCVTGDKQSIEFDNLKYEFMSKIFRKIANYVKENGSYIKNQIDVILTKDDDDLKEDLWIVNKVRDSIIHGAFTIDLENKSINIFNDNRSDPHNSYYLKVSLPISILDLDISFYNFENTSLDAANKFNVFKKKLIRKDRLSYEEIIEFINFYNNEVLGLFQNDISRPYKIPGYIDEFNSLENIIAYMDKYDLDYIKLDGFVNYNDLSRLTIRELARLMSCTRRTEDNSNENVLLYCYFNYLLSGIDEFNINYERLNLRGIYVIPSFDGTQYTDATNVVVRETNETFKKLMELINNYQNNPVDGLKCHIARVLVTYMSNISKKVGVMNENTLRYVRNGMEHNNFNTRQNRITFLDKPTKNDTSVKCFVKTESLFKVCDDILYDKYDVKFKMNDFISYINIANTCKFNKEELNYDKNQLMQYICYFVSFILDRPLDIKEPLDKIIDEINAFIYDYEYNVKIKRKSNMI